MNLPIAFAALALAGAQRAPSDNWPRWRGPDGTGVSRARTALKSLPSAPKVVWSIAAGAGMGSPVVAGGRVYFMDNQTDKETVHAVDASTGKSIWSVPIDDVFTDLQSAPGPRGTPCVDGDLVFVVSCKGEFRCLRASDGSTVWRTHFTKDHGATFIGETGDAAGANRHGNTAAPLVDGDRLYVCVGGVQGSGVVCFEKRTGRVIWRSQNDVAGHAGPVMATIAGVRQLVSYTAEGVIGLDPRTGTLLWRVPVQTRLGRHIVSPVIAGDTVVVGSFTQGLIGVRVSRQGSGLTAERAWTLRDLGVNVACPVAIGETVYGLGPGRTFFAVHARTGEKTWAESRFFGDAVQGEHAGLIVIGGLLLALTDTGQLVLVEPGPTRCRTLASVSVCGRNWCNPALAGGRLFVRDAAQVRCVQLAP